MSTDSNEKEEGTLLNTIGLFVFLALLTVGLVNACWTILDRKSAYRKCNDLWQIRAPVTGVLGYDEETGIPIYKKQRMPNSFKQECKKRLKKR